ncbi:hypothetical protein FV232_01075 [Methylobacterium sp. WL30]|uniref:hypothetical protein n=1 Tax=unclassified Methylobacterium TaxID=2615210 RepID=UPI0011C99EB9|nr:MULTISPECIES: hypothetical protein [unclassified Methylobacterium]TXN38748.1 hypothetical protein FV225_12655 [Methylobacterium sp. WL93]TXN52242.1 hypothetical protein FV227_04095 [Methylobacterium sp. WL119]TXN70675.1 hypothetical protein FV232_01075 [Methylobacterium sp. WL30]
MNQHTPIPPLPSIAETTGLACRLVAATERDKDIATIGEHHGANRTLDLDLMSDLFRDFGWAMLTDEAAYYLASAYERHAELAERISVENRAIRERRS